QGLLPEQPVPDVYVVVPSAQAGLQAASICRALRTAGADVLMHAATAQGQGSMKAQFKRADGSGAAWAVILGDEELASGQVACKSLRVSQEQRMVKIADLATWWQEVRT
ncbi:MAG: His/Gly/Thr/Pro-type tRNA ligase C-terminal domain-containing protein, partial [Burkholderiaceae bacterium]